MSAITTFVAPLLTNNRAKLSRSSDPQSSVTIKNANLHLSARLPIKTFYCNVIGKCQVYDTILEPVSDISIKKFRLAPMRYAHNRFAHLYLSVDIFEASAHKEEVVSQLFDM